MDRPYNKKDAKDKFAVEYVVPFLLERIRSSEDSVQVINLASSMCVFPYRTKHGTRLGCLSKPDVQWYYVRENDNNIVSSDSYRILASEVLKPEDANNLKELFGRLNLITEYSEAAAINSLLDRMSKECDYNASWWDCAFSIYGLWDENKTRVKLTDATRSIENDAFLFQSKYCSSLLKEKLIHHGVYRDITDGVAKAHFWNRVSHDGNDKAIRMLAAMGVPTSFIVDGKISHRIIDLVNRIAKTVDFNSELGAEQKSLCALCHQIFFEKLFKESKSEFVRITSAFTEVFPKGIPMLNTSGKFVPLSLDLFYLSEDPDGDKQQTPNTPTDGDATQETERTIFPVHGDFERLQVDAAKYTSDVLGSLSNVHSFKDVDEPFSRYSLGKIGTDSGAIEFYKWVWNNSQHEQLARNILQHFSGNGHRHSSIPKTEIDFVLDVLKSLKDGDSNCCFDISMHATQAFENDTVLNDIPMRFPKVFLVVYDNFRDFDPHRHLESILESAPIDIQTKRRIRSDTIWEHTHLSTGGNVDRFGSYVIAYRQKNNVYENVLLLWPSEDDFSHTVSIAKYIDATYGTSLADIVSREIDWNAEYQDLAMGIRDFLNEYHETVDPIDIYGNTVTLDDVQTFGQEKSIWLGLKEQRNKIRATKSSKNPLGGGKQREYLSSTYHGRCQICGGRTAMGPQRSYYYTYRIVKESQNELANIFSNILCLCPKCHGELQYGGYMGKDMSALVNLAKEYSSYIEHAINSGDFDDHFPSTIGEFAKDETETEEFRHPIVCDVVVNGATQHMVFSWEHFMRLAFMLSDVDE